MLSRNESGATSMHYGATVLICIACILIGALTGPLPAQTAGNVVAVSTQTIFEISTSGVTTIAQLPTGQTAKGICMSIDNRAVIVLTDTTRNRVRSANLIEVRNGSLRTVGIATKPSGPATLLADGSVIPDQNGDYIASTPLGVLRFVGTGGVVTTLVGNVYSGISEDLLTGGWVTFNGAAAIALSRSGRKTVIASLGGPIPVGSGDIITDTTTGDGFVFSANTVHRLSRSAKTITKLIPGGGTCGDIEPKSRRLLLGAGAKLLRSDLQGQNVTTVTTTPLAISALTVFGSNNVSGFGTAKPGSLYTILASFPQEASLSYQLAMSFGFRPGIPSPGGLIPLAPDPLFFLSIQAPSVFVNFAGTLDANGAAIATVKIPNVPALVGTLMYYSGISYDNSGILTIAEPKTLLIE